MGKATKNGFLIVLAFSIYANLKRLRGVLIRDRNLAHVLALDTVGCVETQDPCI